MATKDTPPGLLARVANLVRSPTQDAPEQVSATSAEQGELGKLAIKRMVERKAHNDAIRQREFSQLRKLREASPAALSEMAARASFYQDSSSFPVSEARASTLKKIDEIEAQMSKQWWNGQQRKPADAPPPPVAAQPTAPVVAPGVSRSSLGRSESQIDTCSTFAPTMPTHLDEPGLSKVVKSSPASTRFDKSRSVAWSPAGFPGFEATDYNGFSNSNVVSVEMGQTLSDPVLEDAAIRFANSDDAGAESVLMLALKGEVITQEARDVWTIALLDLYRSTGQQAMYERLSLDYAQQSDGAGLHLLAAARPTGLAEVNVQGEQALPAATDGVLWQSPAVLDRASVDQLQTSVVPGRGLTRLDWHGLETITPEAAVALVALMGRWCDQALNLQFDSLERLDALLRVNTPLGDREVAPVWWYLRLTVLRVLGSQEEYELVSMDYCVTYEVSPPAWQSALCQRVFGLHMTTSGVALDVPGRPEAASTQALTDRSPFVDANASRIELVGEVLGTVATGLKPLQIALLAKGDLLIDCEGLVRVDFSAAGSILNWVASAQASGKKIEFTRLSHLVAAFFNLIGINEHARVTGRTN